MSEKALDPVEQQLDAAKEKRRLAVAAMDKKNTTVGLIALVVASFFADMDFSFRK